MEESLINNEETKITTCSNRSLGLDILRILAFMCVIGVHMFSLNHYYQLNPNSVPMYFLTFIRNFFMICIPLFLMISGYLLANKEPTVSYFKKIFRILIEYLIASICCTIFSALYYHGFDIINFLEEFSLLNACLILGI